MSRRGFIRNLSAHRRFESSGRIERLRERPSVRDWDRSVRGSIRRGRGPPPRLSREELSDRHRNIRQSSAERRRESQRRLAERRDREAHEQREFSRSPRGI